MSAQRKMDVRQFFSSVKIKHHLANLVVQDCRDEEKNVAEAMKKIEQQNEANRLASKKRRDDAMMAEVAEDRRTDEDRLLFLMLRAAMRVIKQYKLI